MQKDGVMTISRRGLLGSTVPAALLPHSRAQAQAPRIRLGVLSDQSGPYSSSGGATALICIRQAVQEFGSADRGLLVEVVSGDHQNKADVGAGIARQWLDQGEVDCILEISNSAVALAVQSIVRARNKVFIVVSAGTTSLTGDQCSPNMLHWTFDNYMLAHSTSSAMLKSGGDSWYFLTADYAFGQQLESETAQVVLQSGGRVLGHSRYPPYPDTTDFSSLLIQAQASGAKVLGLANAGADTQNCIKQAHEFGLNGRMRIVALLMYLNDVHAIGLQTAQGLFLTESFYWDLNDSTRAWTKKVVAQSPNNWPSMSHAGSYAATAHYLKTVADMGVADAKKDGIATVNHMKAMPFSDPCFGTGKIREDGRVLVPAYLFEVKKPSESTSAWDCYNLRASMPGDQAYRPLADGHCSFVKL
jgi:branched-chain amino acid transport system substrate-binding protein